ncbi:D-alanyl-D-alanine carboxypeptidase/D-alanyl-D-alanine-endopeptidase [Longispora fulva]|uniref:D-alanyl-D-alanine carboxypeptidase/D-alanyl-D-alanine-endopeptidase (Penicillin-binding protein 4) n=1 Tax=Longispora fulva TaxID=619741 RepID=A0A8J7KLE3_9ACTN|nr:D-alanyl-D-alanine carboxypeptidase [Longispora fulva]MBG6139249.1 D-alanyl-D-alanine carboxypeptidase/D-alanyl-D-alanine-endopeptidase (penicillin-binding protein 4) [Longispora fulva]
MPGLADEKQPVPVLEGATRSGQPLTADSVAKALGPALADSRLGPKVSSVVLDLETGDRLYDKSGDTLATPASTIKLSTAAAALVARGSEYRIETKVVAGPNPGEVVIIGGGDVTLSVDGAGAYPGAGKLSDLATQVKTALAGQAVTKVIVDSSLFTGAGTGPGWAPADIGSWVNTVVPLAVDGGRVDPKDPAGEGAKRQPDPAASAGSAFAKLLSTDKVSVVAGKADVGAREYGKVLSPTIGRLVEFALLRSDNVLAEALARQAALGRGKQASFEGAMEGVQEAVAGLGLTPPTGQVDGSGMSPKNQVPASYLGGLFVRAAKPDHPELRYLFTGLPVAGFSGGLDPRYPPTADGTGVVRAKTGTLTGVDALAGVITTKSGRAVVFVVMADASPSFADARPAIDKAAGQLAKL